MDDGKEDEGGMGAFSTPDPGIKIDRIYELERPDVGKIKMPTQGSRMDATRTPGGFDFLLYQKKAGLQQAAEEAKAESEKKEEAAAAADTGPVERVERVGGKVDKRRPPGPMYLSWKQMEDEERDRLKKAGLGDLPCKDDYYLRMRHRLWELYKNHLHPLEAATPFRALYDDPMDEADFIAVPYVMCVIQPGLYKEKFLQQFLDDAFIIRDPKRRADDVGDRLDRDAGGMDMPMDDAESVESLDDDGRMEGGFDFLLYQKKAGLQQAAEEAKAETEKKEQEAAAGPEDTGPAVTDSGPKELRSKHVVWKDHFVFVAAIDSCFGAPGTCRDFRAEDLEREQRLKEEAEEKRREEAAAKKRKEEKERKKKAQEAREKAEKAIYDPFNLGWEKPKDFDEDMGLKPAEVAKKKRERKKAGFDFLLFQKKAGLQEAAQAESAAAEKKEEGPAQQETEMQYMDDDRSEDFIEVDEFLPGREVLKTVPRIMNFGGLIAKLGPAFVHDHLRGYQTESYTLTKFNCLMCPDIPDATDVPEGGGSIHENPLRQSAGFDFLLYQKKAGLQQAAEEAKAASEKKEETAAAVDTGPQQKVSRAAGFIQKKRPPGYKDDTPKPWGYCYEQAMRFFARKADRVFVIADMRRDMTNRFAMTLEAIKPFHGKISVIYMYPENVGIPYCIDRYSFCTWNISKVLKDRTDPPRFYGNIFRDPGGLTNCLYYGDQEMYHELYYIDKFSNLRLAYEIQRRAMLCAILGTLQNDLKASMPKLRLPFKLPRVIRLNIPGMKECITIPILNRTERAKREALYSLDYRFFSLQETEKLPLTSFPCAEHLADVLVYKDIDKLDSINPSWIQIAKGIAEEDCVRIITRLKESYPTHILEFDPECSMECANDDFEFVVQKKDQFTFDTAFDALRPDMEDQIDVETVIDSLMPLNLPPGAVCRLAFLADVNKDGKLGRDEFYSAMHLALRKLHGLELPIKLPLRMWPCLKRNKLTETAYRRMTELGKEHMPKLFYPEEHPPPLCPVIPKPKPPPPPEPKKPAPFLDWGNMFGPPIRRKPKPGTVDSLLEGGDHVLQLFAAGKKKFRDVRIQEDLITFGGWRATGSMSHFFSFL